MQFNFGSDGSSDFDGLKNFFGPGQVDAMIRQAIQMCWLALPSDKKRIGNVEEEIHRLVARALRDFKDDAQAFGVGDIGD
jgi:hypothetical protein